MDHLYVSEKGHDPKLLRFVVGAMLGFITAIPFTLLLPDASLVRTVLAAAIPGILLGVLSVRYGDKFLLRFLAFCRWASKWVG